MVKITTLFKKDPTNLALVINEVNPENSWVFEGEGIATRKYDGTAAAIIDGELYKRYDVKKGRQVPFGAIPCQEPDEITGRWPHWVKCYRDNKEDKYFFEGLENYPAYPATLNNGTYELCGPKVNGNNEKLEKHELIKHGLFIIKSVILTFEGIKNFLENHDFEGIVFHHRTFPKMCKIRKSDFGIKRTK